MTHKDWLFSLPDEKLKSAMENIDEIVSDWSCDICKLKNGLNAHCFCHPNNDDFHCPEYSLTSYLNSELLTDEELKKISEIRKAGSQKAAQLYKELEKDRKEHKCKYCIHKNVCQKVKDTCRQCKDYIEEKHD